MSITSTTVGAVLTGIVSGKSVQTLDRPAQGSEFGILKVSAVTWGEFRPYENKAMPPEYNPGACPRPMDGDILISRANTRELVGAPVMVHGNHPQLLLSDKLLKLIPDELVVDRRYLVRALRTPAASSHFFNCAGGSSGSMTNITQSDIRTAPIPLPPLPEQRRIAAILDQADALRAKRREALAQLDSLTQSIFIEMFGGANEYPVSSLADLCELITDGTHQTPEYADEGVIFLSAKNVTSGYVDWEKIKFIPESLHRELHRRLSPKVNDILLAKNGTTGVAAMVDRDCTFDIYVSLALLRAKQCVLPAYLLGAINSPICKKQFNDSLKGIGVPNLHLKEIRATQIPHPPLSLQNEFLSRITSIEKLKVSQRSSLAELDALFASLQHRAFRGEL